MFAGRRLVLASAVALVGAPAALAQTPATTIESRSSSGVAGPGEGGVASANGRWVAFSSFAAHVPNDTGFATTDFYLRDRLTGQTRAVNVGADGAPAGAGNGVGPDISEDGRYIAFSHPADRLVSG